MAYTLPPVTPALAKWLADATAHDPIIASETLRAEASTRAFFRLRLRSGDTRIAMHAPVASERNDAFLHVQALLQDAGLNVPRVLAQAPSDGFFLLSDLGCDHFADAYQRGDADAAVAAGLVTLAQLQAIAPTGIAPYTASRLHDELGIFSEWFAAPLAAGRLPENWPALCERLVGNAVSQSQVLVHLDYHSRNLLLARDGSVGIVDFQDALVGPWSYDLACLLHDCYHRFGDAAIDRYLAHFLQLSGRNAHTLAEARTLLDLMGIQRNLKALGIFVRLRLRDGKRTHLEHVPPVLAATRHLTQRYPHDPELAKLGAYLDAIRDDALLALARLT